MGEVKNMHDWFYIIYGRPLGISTNINVTNRQNVVSIMNLLENWEKEDWASLRGGREKISCHGAATIPMGVRVRVWVSNQY